MTEQYKLSRNYEKLYEKVCNGLEAFCLVDYKRRWSDESPVLRDICRCRRRGPFEVMFGSRGVEYGGVYYYNRNEDEKTVFIAECERMNLEWLDPDIYIETIPPTKSVEEPKPTPEEEKLNKELLRNETIALIKDLNIDYLRVFIWGEDANIDEIAEDVRTYLKARKEEGSASAFAFIVAT